MLELYPLALALTLAVELAVVAAFAGRGRRRFVLLVALLVNLFTHPLACAAYWDGIASFTTIEILVVAAETIGYRFAARLDWRRAAALAVGANTVTAAMSWLF